MNKLISIIIFCCCIFSSAFAQEKKYIYQDSTLIEKAPDQIIVEAAPDEDTDAPKEEVAVKTYEQNTIDTTLYFHEYTTPVDSVNNWKKQKAFGYINKMDSLLKAQKIKPEEPKERSSSNFNWLANFFNSDGLKIFLWILAGAFILFILYKLFLTKGIFQRNALKKDAVSTVVVEEIITSESDFDALIKNAEQAKNYRLAVRYQYLKALHLLANNNVIQMAADKTNYQYVSEIKSDAVRNSFAALTLNYEYVWYGEFNIDEILYHKIKTGFVNFNTN
jgi:hypothetical protein